ncbi:MAG: OBAP family protein [Myxococcaceae bacterium]|nr:OBAP family protein [Myxococcaceae bacterium]MCI0669093.1 OBAP family protein [Myxococcaceae bacterium]
MRCVMGGVVALGMTMAVTAWADDRKPAPPASSLPPAKLSLWLDGFHMRDGHPDEQGDIHHFCQTPKTGPIQCALFDGFGENAKLVGIEYIVDATTFASLPESERKLWHSHVYEVTSGALVAPGMAEQEETAFLKKAITTYGKTWHTWDPMLSEKLPLGRPELMMSFTRDGVLRPELAAARDATLGTNTAQLRANRAKSIPQVPTVMKGADVGEGGTSCKESSDVARARRGPARR